MIRIEDNLIVGFDALTRWNHPQRDVLAPDAFVPAAAQLGLLPAIDDFGTGYSSLSQLGALDVDIRKIDKSHVANLEQSPLNEIVHAIIDLARAPAIRTVAQGIETNAHLALQHQIRADEAQGYRSEPGVL